MSELEKPWGDQNVFDWYFSEDNDIEIMTPMGDSGIGLHIVAALATIYDAVVEERMDDAKDHLLRFAELVVGGAMGIGSYVAEELIIQDQMKDFDDSLNNLLEDTE